LKVAAVCMDVVVSSNC